VTKTDLIDKVAKSVNITKVVANDVFESMIETIKDGLKNGEKITIIGFGTFSVSERKARKGRNPKTGEPIDIAESKAPKFTPSDSFKKEFN
jgi:DNA-binding protein HU-beta